MFDFREVQSQQVICELSPELELELADPPPPPQDPCFDKGYVIENCVPVYVRTNIHFILADDCMSDIATTPGVPGDLSPNNGFKIAEQIVDDANEFFENVNIGQNSQWNQVEHNATFTLHQCIPTRYVLTGVYFHCSTSAMNTGISFDDFDAYYVNNSTEVNVFISNVSGSTNGFASNLANRIVVEHFQPGLFNHEMGHVVSLRHTHEADDFCLDTWPHSWTWDNGCDGSIDQSASDGCWGTGSDYLVNGVEPCDPLVFCNAHPCCAWPNQNNNLMCYSKWAINSVYSALTPCQIDLAYNDLSGTMCPYIEEIGGDCPPPYANIGTVPLDGESSSDCFFCVHLEASVNDRYFQLEILEDAGNGNYIQVAGTEWTDGPVGKYCIFLREENIDKNWHIGVQPDHEYLFVLTVENECGDEHQQSQLIYIPPAHPNCVPDNQSGIELTPYPNPTTGNLNFTYAVQYSGEVQMYIIEAFTSVRIDILHTPNIQPGTYNGNISLSGYNNGLFYFVYRLDEELHIETILKT